MRLSELILAVGDDNVQFQNLDTSATSLDWSRKAGSRITFATEEPIVPGDGTVRLGLVLWFDREAVKQALKTASSAFAPQAAKVGRAPPSPPDAELGPGKNTNKAPQP